MRTIPVDLILHETALKLRELPEEHHRGLADDIAGFCTDFCAVAEEWTSGAGVAQQAAWLVRRLDEDIGKPAFLPVTAGPGMSVVPTGQMVAAETRTMEVAVARRLADCALSLLVTQDAEDAATAQTLLQAAQRVVGLATAKPGAEAVLFTSATDNADDGLSPATLRRYLAATRDALGLGSGPVFLSDIVTCAKSLADADKARHAAEVENANKASIIAKQEKTIANLTHERNVARHDMKNADAEIAVLKRERDAAIAETVEHGEQIDAWSSWATKLAGLSPKSTQLSANALRETLSARLIESKGQRLKVSRDCLPPGVDIIACLRDDKPTTYKASNTGEEYDTPEAAVRAAWEHHLRPTQSSPEGATPSTGTIRSMTVNGVTQEVNIPVKAGDTISFSKDNEVVVKPREFKVGDKVRFARIRSGEAYRKEAPPLGWVGEITDIDGSDLPIRASGPSWQARDGEQGWWFTAADLDLVTPTA